MELIAVILLVLLVLFGEVGLYRRRGLEGLSYYCHFSETECTEGESLQFVETVTNDKTLPVPWLKAELTTSRWLDFPEANSAVTGENRFVSSFFSVRSRSRVSRVWEITCEKRGVYEMEHIVLVTSDLLGIVRLSLHAADHGGKLTVLPKRLTEAGLLLPKLLRQQYGEQVVRCSLLTDPCLSAGVREYVTGDPIHRMHWKASAHAGTLLMRQEERTARQTTTVLLALESHRPDAGQMTPDSELLEHTIRVCAQCLWEFCSNGWQVRLCVGERNAKGNPIATPYGAGNTMYHRLLQQLAELQLQDVLSMPRLLSLSASRMTQETVLLITPYTDRRVARWKQQSGGLVLVTGHAHDSGNCADAVVPAPEYLRNGEAAL